MVITITSILGLCVASLIIFLIRKDRLHVDHGVGWLIVAASFALLGFAPRTIDRVAHILGVDYPNSRHYASDRDLSNQDSLDGYRAFTHRGTLPEAGSATRNAGGRPKTPK